MQLLSGGETTKWARFVESVERRRLVRVLAVAQGSGLLETDCQLLRERLVDAQISRDCCVVARDVLERFGSQLAPILYRVRTVPRSPKPLHRFLVVGRIHQDGHGRMVFRRGPQHRWPADIDVLQRFFDADIRPSDRLAKRIEVHADDVDRSQCVRLEFRQVLRLIPAGQDAAVHRRMQGLHPPVQDLRKAGEGGDRMCGQPGLHQVALRAAGGVDIEAQLGKAQRQLLQASFVVWGEERDHGLAADISATLGFLARTSEFTVVLVFFRLPVPRLLEAACHVFVDLRMAAAERTSDHTRGSFVDALELHHPVSGLA